VLSRSDRFHGLGPAQGLLQASVRAVLFICLSSVCIDALHAGESEQIQPLLVGASEHHATIEHVLVSLRNDRLQPLEQLPAAVFRAPLARRGAVPARHWTHDLADAINTLQDARLRDRALASLEQRFIDSLPPLAGREERARAALHYLPAPSAVRSLVERADRAFDRGEFRRYLRVTALLDQRAPRWAVERASESRRRSVALTLMGLADTLPDELHLKPPGAPQRQAGGAADANTEEEADDQGLHVRWLRAAGQLIAADPWRRALWQRPLGRRQQLLTGPGAALLDGPSGLTLLDEDGSSQQLQRPPQAVPLGLRGRSVFFHDAQRIWRLALRDGSIHAFALPAAPLCAPLVRDGRSLWLTARDLILVIEDQVAARYAHDIAAAELAHPRLIDSGDRLLLRTSTASWQITTLEPAADPTQRVAQLSASYRPDEALELWRQLPAAVQVRARRAAMHAVMALPAGAAAISLTEAERLAENTRELATLLLHSHGIGSHAAGARLRQLAREHPGLLVPIDADGDPFGDPSRWRYAIALRALAQRGAGAAGPTLTPADLRADAPAVLASSRALPADATGDRVDWSDANERLQVLGRYAVDLQRDGARITLRCYDDPGLAALWQRSWRLDSLQPGLQVALRDAHILVAAGQDLRSFHAASGGLQIAVSVPVGEAWPETMSVCGQQRLAYLSPPGIGDTLVILEDGDGETRLRRIPLPSPGRWSLGIAGVALIAHQDGGLRLWPGGATSNLPAALADGPRPRLSEAGLLQGDRLWPWVR